MPNNSTAVKLINSLTVKTREGKVVWTSDEHGQYTTTIAGSIERFKFLLSVNGSSIRYMNDTRVGWQRFPAVPSESETLNSLWNAVLEALAEEPLKRALNMLEQL